MPRICKGVVHRDLKPANIMVTSERAVKLRGTPHWARLMRKLNLPEN